MEYSEEAGYREFAGRFGNDGTWRLLFGVDHQPIHGIANRLGEAKFTNPRVLSGDSSHSFTEESAAIPVLHEWEYIRQFEKSFGSLDSYPSFLKAGERRDFTKDHTNIVVGIVVAGGPASGLNMVVDSIVKRHFALATLTARAEASLSGNRPIHNLSVFGYLRGYYGLQFGTRVLLAPARSALAESSYPPGAEVWCTDEWSSEGGIRLRSGRAKDYISQDDAVGKPASAEELAQHVVEAGLDILYVIGGDGTLRFASKISESLRQCDSQCVVVGGPKTMDNDIMYTDVTFGFRTAVANAIDFVKTIHTTAESLDRLAIIELFGAGAGFVALEAGYASGVADYVMIPELRPPDLTYDAYEDRVLDMLRRRLEKNNHAVLVVAEGALAGFQHGDHLVKAGAFSSFLEKAKRTVRHGVADVRARYLIRDTQPDAFDLMFCKISGKLMADTALAGYTDCSVHLWQGDYVLVPFNAATTRTVDWWSYTVRTMLDRERLTLTEVQRREN